MLFDSAYQAHSAPSHRPGSAWARHAVDRKRSGRCQESGRTSTPNAVPVGEPRPTDPCCPPASAPRPPHRRCTPRAHHKPRRRRCQSSPTRRRKADPSRPRHGLGVARTVTATPSTKRRATHRAPTQKSPCVEPRGHVPFDGQGGARPSPSMWVRRPGLGGHSRQQPPPLPVRWPTGSRPRWHHGLIPSVDNAAPRRPSCVQVGPCSRSAWQPAHSSILRTYASHVLKDPLAQHPSQLF